MTELQQEFLRQYVICQLSYETVSKQLNIPRATLTEWYEELRIEREAIAKIRNVWTKKKFTPVFENFYIWHQSIERKCEYCGITEDEIKKMLDNEVLKTKRINTRGRKLEFDRKIPDLEYSEVDNVVLCCYWCNNAKTDTFTYEEFKEVGKTFAKIWTHRLAKTNQTAS